jgi:TadE-like protein
MTRPNMRRPGKNPHSKERGSALVEFIVCFSLLWVPLFLGAVQFGFKLIEALEVNQACRDAGHLHAYGVDFSQSSNQYLLASFAPRLNVDVTGAGGDGVVILSTIKYVDDATCLAGGYTSTTGCSNYQKDVITYRVVVGKTTLQSSVFGTPSSNILDTSTGKVQSGGPTTTGYLNDPSAVATNFSSVIALSSGATGQQTAYVSEMFVRSTTLNWFMPGTQWIASRNVF